MTHSWVVFSRDFWGFLMIPYGFFHDSHFKRDEIPPEIIEKRCDFDYEVLSGADVSGLWQPPLSKYHNKLTNTILGTIWLFQRTMRNKVKMKFHQNFSQQTNLRHPKKGNPFLFSLILTEWPVSLQRDVVLKAVQHPGLFPAVSPPGRFRNNDPKKSVFCLIQQHGDIRGDFSLFTYLPKKDDFLLK